MNGTTRYSPEAPAEGLYQVGLFTSALSDLYHGYLKISPCLQLYIFIIGYNQSVPFFYCVMSNNSILMSYISA